MIYELDKNHILVFEIESSENIISKDLINKITFSNVKNYANNITKEKVLKRFSSYKKDKVDEINIKLPNTKLWFIILTLWTKKARLLLSL